MKKKTLALLLGLALCLSLTACGGGQSAQTGGADAEAETVTDEQEAAVEEQAEEAGDAEQAEAGDAEEAGEEGEEGTVTIEAFRSEELPLKSGDGDIYGILYMPVEQKETYPTIIMSHGFGGNYTNCEPYAQIFASNGYACYAYDFQGGGEESRSSGTMQEMSVLTEAADLAAVLEQIKALDFVDPDHVFLYGQSQGGFVSSYVGAEHPEDVKAMVLYYPAFVLQDDARQRFPDADAIPETEDFMGHTLGGIYARDAMSFDIYDVIGGYTGDVLIIHGDQDPIVPLSYAERANGIYASSNLIVIPGAGHGFQDADRSFAAAETLTFLDAHLD